MAFDVNKLPKLKALQSLATIVKADQDKITTLIGSDANKSVRTIANEELAAQLIPEHAKEALDTLAEIAAWIQDHPDDAAAMNSKITALEGVVGDSTAGLWKDVNDLKSTVGDATQGLVKGVDDLQDGLGDVEADVTALKSTVGDATAGLVKDVNDLKAVGATKTEASQQNGYIKIDGVETKVYELPSTVLDESDIATDAEVAEMLAAIFGA
jgi:uncharacterized phage infection (PIP) family protein YhgE